MKELRFESRFRLLPGAQSSFHHRPKCPLDSRKKIGIGPIGLLNVVPYVVSPLFKDLFAVDAQTGSVTSLTAGEQTSAVGVMAGRWMG